MNEERLLPEGLPPATAILQDLVARARASGADAADAVSVTSTSVSYNQRLGQPELLERSESTHLGLRVLVGHRQALVSSAGPSSAGPSAAGPSSAGESTGPGPGELTTLVERAVAMARSVPEDPYCGLADGDAVATAETLAVRGPALDMADPQEPPSTHLQAQAAAAEDAARAVPGVTNSEGASAAWGRTEVALVASNGFAGHYARTGCSVSLSVLAGSGTAMERDYDFTAAVHGGDLDRPEKVGRRAGEQAVRRLNPRKVATQTVPVVYDPRTAKGLIAALANGANGAAIARGTSFLKDRLGQRLFRPGIRIVDDPLRPRGLRSRPYDGEGLATDFLALVKDGELRSFVMDLRSARQLGLRSTGHASRGTGAPPMPSTTNLYLEAGAVSPNQLIAEIKAGFYVTETMGMGVNPVTGDYSQGATGFWIENGALAYPVSEVTIASNLIDMFATLTPADDLVFKYGTNAPTVRIDAMTVAGA